MVLYTLYRSVWGAADLSTGDSMSVRAEPRKAATDVKVGRSVAEVLRSRILSGDLVPGQRLIEADLLAELDVGRSAIREAFVQLDAEGLVELRHQRGAAVMRLSRRDMAEHFAVRERLEGLAAYLAAERIEMEGHREWLTAQRQLWLRAEMSQNERAHMEENIPFHEGIVRMAGNGRLADALRRMQIPAYRQKFMQLFDETHRRRAVDDHLMMIDAMLAGDPQKAEDCARAHVRRTGELAQQIEGLDGFGAHASAEGR
jgi:DNA-binding GntR family transcriptional regulator